MHIAPLLVAAMLAGSTTAGAREAGVPVGEFTLKPYVSVMGVVDSNVYRAAKGYAEGDGGVEVQPRFAIVYPGKNFRWTLNTGYRFLTYFNANNTNHSNLRVVGQFDVSSTFDVNRQGKLGFWFGPKLGNAPVRRGGADNVDHQMTVTTPLRVLIRPTKAFTIDVDGHWAWERSYRPARAFDPNPIQLGDRHDVGGGLGVDWRFFPRSHLTLDGEVARNLWTTLDSTAVNHTQRDPATYWRAYFGIKTDITRKLAMLAQIGYGGIYFAKDTTAAADNLKGAEGLLGRFELAISPVQTQRFTLGFDRNFEFVYFANRSTETTGYFGYKGQFGGRLGLNVDFSYIHRDFKGGLDRWENQWAAGAGVEVMVTEFFVPSVKYTFSAMNPTTNQTGEYTDHRILLGVALGFR